MVGMKTPLPAVSVASESATSAELCMLVTFELLTPDLAELEMPELAAEEPGVDIASFVVVCSKYDPDIFDASELNATELSSTGIREVVAVVTLDVALWDELEAVVEVIVCEVVCVAVLSAVVVIVAVVVGCAVVAGPVHISNRAKWESVH